MWWSHFYKVQKQAKVIPGVRSLKSGRQCCGVAGREWGRERVGTSDVLVFDLGAGYLGVFGLWKFIKLYVFLYVSYVSIRSL